MWPEVANVNVPTVLLAGKLDQVDSIERHRTEVVAYIPNVEFKIIKGRRHLIPIDEPVQLANEIASFVGKLAHRNWSVNEGQCSDAGLIAVYVGKSLGHLHQSCFEVGNNKNCLNSQDALAGFT